MEKEYKIRDFIKICDNPPKDRNFGPSWVSEMDKLCGKEFEVVAAIDYKDCCTIKDNESDYYWIHVDWIQPKIPIVEAFDFGII